MRLHHQPNSTKICDVCAKTFSCVKTFQSHWMTHSSQPRMQCTICGKWLKSKDSLRSQLRRHNDTQHACQYCQKKTPNRQALANHILYVHSEKTHKCTLCDKTFKAAMGLKVGSAIDGRILYCLDRSADAHWERIISCRSTWPRIPARASTRVPIVRDDSTPTETCISIGRICMSKSGAVTASRD